MQTQTPPNPVHIVILDRGNVLVGNVSLEGDWVITRNASVIRRWGTTRGLGEIAMGGPTKLTQLDPIGTVKSPIRALIGLIDCEAGKWTL